MICFKPFIYGIIIIYFTASAHALPPMLVDSNDLDWVGNSPGDPLDPSFVGETMSMPLDPELIQKARDAGIIKDRDQPYSSHESGYGFGAVNLGTPLPGSEYSEPGTVGPRASPEVNLNVTGGWSLDLISLDRVLRHMDLALIHKNDVVMGYGIITGDSDLEKVTASGSESGKRLLLTIMPVDGLYLYKLDLSLDLNTRGTYTAYSPDGRTWSGDIAGTAPLIMAAS